MSAEHSHEVLIYYEDTDHSGLVYHANYLKYFERAREHLFGREALVELLDRDGIGFVVYKAELTFRQGARFGDALEIRSRVTKESDFRLLVHQRVVDQRSQHELVTGVVHMVCIDRDKKLVRLPTSVVDRVVG